MSEQIKSISEVAKAAGVSTATVSRVLNGLPGVRDETIAHVREAMHKLNYSRLRTRSVAAPTTGRTNKLRTGSIAVITLGHGQAWFQWPVMASVLGGIQRGAHANGVRLLLGEMNDPREPSELLVNRQVDGAIVLISSDVPIATYETMFKLVQKHAPVVWAMGMEMAINGVDHVAPDNVGIGYMAFTYLQGLGCQRPAFLATDPNWPFMRLRGQSFMNSAFDAGFAPRMYAVATDDRMLRPYGGEVITTNRLGMLIEQLAKSPDRPDGLFVGNDHVMSQVHPLLKEHGIRIGTDIQVVSCDAEEARLSGMNPRPASIDIGGDEIGYRSVNRLLGRIERPNGPSLIIQIAPRIQLPDGMV